MVYFDATQYLWAASIGVAALIYFLKPILGEDDKANRRISLIGSRFSPMTDAEGTLANRPPVALDDRALPDPRQGMMSQN